MEGHKQNQLAQTDIIKNNNVDHPLHNVTGATFSSSKWMFRNNALQDRPPQEHICPPLSLGFNTPQLLAEEKGGGESK